MYMCDNGIQAKVYCYNVGKEASSHRRDLKRQVSQIGWKTLEVPKSTVGHVCKGRKETKAHDSTSSNQSYAKKHCIVWNMQFHKLYLSNGHLLVTDTAQSHMLIGKVLCTTIYLYAGVNWGEATIRH